MQNLKDEAFIMPQQKTFENLRFTENEVQLNNNFTEKHITPAFFDSFLFLIF